MLKREGKESRMEEYIPPGSQFRVQNTHYTKFVLLNRSGSKFPNFIYVCVCNCYATSLITYPTFPLRIDKSSRRMIINLKIVSHRISIFSICTTQAISISSENFKFVNPARIDNDASGQVGGAGTRDNALKAQRPKLVLAIAAAQP